jgi:hypothetical protein
MYMVGVNGVSRNFPQFVAILTWVWNTRLHYNAIKKESEDNGKELTIYKFKSRNSAFMAVLHFTDTIGSSTMRITHILKWVRKRPSLQLSGTIYVRPGLMAFLVTFRNLWLY